MKKKNQANLLARECIVTALIQLCGQKPFSAISISELTKRAGVSRMTYYRNYCSKEEVFQSHMNEIVEAYREDVCRIKRPETYGEYENIFHCFRYFEAHKVFITCLLKVGMGNLLLDALSSYMISAYYTEGDSAELYYTLIAYAGALFNVYIAWLKNGTRESVGELADIIYAQTNRSQE